MWLWGAMCADGQLPSGEFHSSSKTIRLAELAGASVLGGRLEDFRGSTALIAARDPLTAALALIELDGVAHRIVLCPPDLAASHFPAVIQTAGAVGWVRDAAVPEENGSGLELSVTAEPVLTAGAVTRHRSHETEWILLTSGTTGAPKLVLHTLASLTSTIVYQQARQQAAPARAPVWSTFYDIRRYGGLQIFLRAALCGGSLVLSDPKEPVTEFLARAAAAGITHISGTPSHWRRSLMSGAAATITPAYVRLSGEIADQAILDSLQAAYPSSGVAHAFASTEAGVAFEVGDGHPGFPESLVGAPGPVELKVAGGTLHIRSDGNAARYLGDEAAPLRAADGFVDTGDRVELREGRYYFMGRAGGVINVGGLKVHPEEVEAVINAIPWVRMSLVKARRNPITGAVVTADVVLADDEAAPRERPEGSLSQEIIEACRRGLPVHKVPAMVRIVPSLEVSAAGKLVRPGA